MNPRHRILGLIVAILTGCAMQAQTSTQSTTKPAMSDAAIENAIRQRFARSKVAADGFTVRVQGGVATIDGKTDVVQRKGAATRMAKSAGAKRVINRIQVSESARQKAGSNLAKGRRRAQVKRSEAPR